jgi:hypothetical protein
VESENKRVGRKLLVASLGVAAVSFGACGRHKPLSVDAAADSAKMADASAPDRPDASVDSLPDAGDTADAAEAPDRHFVGNLA